MSLLDFSELSDDQIVELASALAHEALLRKPAVAAAFEQAIITEKDRAEAALKGSAAAKAVALRAIKEEAEREEHERLRELRRKRNRDAMARFLHACARITERPAQELTLVWFADYYGLGPRLHLNAGTTGDHANWHLVDYNPGTSELKTTPGLRAKTAQLLKWARETCAYAKALKLVNVTVQGIEL